MLLTITSDHQPATDLGYLLHKNPANLHRVKLAFGEAVMFFPEATEARCTFALTLDVDPVALVRGREGAAGGPLDQYVNDRPYAASSLLSVALGRALNTAMAGRCRERPALAETALEFAVRLTPLPCRGDPALVQRLFEPLGYTVTAMGGQLDPEFPDWGTSPYVDLRLNGRQRLADLLTHLYVLVPVLDDAKHYWVGEDELAKLMRKGGDWLKAHPERDLIARRYLKHRPHLVRAATARLAEGDEALDERGIGDDGEAALEKPIRLNDQRLDRVAAALADAGAAKVLDLGCGEGKLIRRLLAEPGFRRIIGVDASPLVLSRAAARLKLDRMPELKRQRVALLHGALTYADKRFAGHDAAALVEVIEHIDPDRLPAVERVVFERARPATVIVTTPNREYNALFENLNPERLRHSDHRFEWTRAEFRTWAERVAETHGYTVRYEEIGAVDAELGAPTQMAVFGR